MYSLLRSGVFVFPVLREDIRAPELMKQWHQNKRAVLDVRWTQQLTVKINS